MASNGSVYALTSTDNDTGQRNITVFVIGGKAQSCDDTHPNFERIQELALDGDPDVLELFDVAETVSTRFEKITDRIAVKGGTLYFDGDPVHNSLTKQVVRFLEEGEDDWVPLVNFFEKVQNNPESHSRDQLHEWLDRHAFPIIEDGNFIAYKGVSRGTEEGTFQSSHAGYGIVNGQEFQHAHLPQSVGDVVEIPRSMVHHDPAVGCSVGLHVGTYEYAKGYASGGLLKVLVDPRDVVSVPTDCNAQKIRVCRYSILDTTETKIESAYVAPDYDDEDEYDEDEYCECGEHVDDCACDDEDDGEYCPICGDPDCDFEL